MVHIAGSPKNINVLQYIGAVMGAGKGGLGSSLDFTI